MNGRAREQQSCAMDTRRSGKRHHKGSIRKSRELVIEELREQKAALAEALRDLIDESHFGIERRRASRERAVAALKKHYRCEG